MTQAAFIITLGMAEVFVLLLGEIDLAAGFTAACGAVIALYLVAKNYPWWVAILACLAATGLYGAVQGFIITRLRLPSFVVTLAGYLFLSGAAPVPDRLHREHRQRRRHPAEQQHPQRHRGRSTRRGRQLDRDDRAGVAGRRHDVPPGPPPAFQRPGRPAAVCHPAEGRGDRGGRCRGGAGGQQQPGHAIPGRARTALGRAGGAGHPGRLHDAARADPIRPLYLRDRRQRRGGPPGRRQHQPDQGGGVRICAA